MHALNGFLFKFICAFRLISNMFFLVICKNPVKVILAITTKNATNHGGMLIIITSKKESIRKVCKQFALYSILKNNNKGGKKHLGGLEDNTLKCDRCCLWRMISLPLFSLHCFEFPTIGMKSFHALEIKQSVMRQKQRWYRSEDKVRMDACASWKCQRPPKRDSISTPTENGFFHSGEIEMPFPIPEPTKNAILKLSRQR